MDRIVAEFIKISTIEQLNAFRLEGKPLLHVLHLNSQGLLEQQALDRGVDVHQEDDSGNNYISLVSKFNKYVSVDVMGEIASFLPFEERQVLRGVNKEFRLLIDKMNIRDFQNLSAPQIRKIIDYIIEHNDIQTLNYVLDRNMDPSANDNEAIRFASREGHLEIVERLLKDPRVDPGSSYNWAIREASREGHLEVVERLLKDPRVDPGSSYNWAIREAISNDHPAVVERLLQDRRVNPSVDNNYAIRWASMNGHLSVVDKLLQDQRVDPRVENNYAIRAASYYGHLDVVDRLLKDPRVDPSALGNEAIRWASANGHLAVVKRLLQDPRVDPSVLQ